jgi:hypothetical protein
VRTIPVAIFSPPVAEGKSFTPGNIHSRPAPISGNTASNAFSPRPPITQKQNEFDRLPLKRADQERLCELAGDQVPLEAQHDFLKWATKSASNAVLYCRHHQMSKPNAFVSRP